MVRNSLVMLLLVGCASVPQTTQPSVTAVKEIVKYLELPSKDKSLLLNSIADLERQIMLADKAHLELWAKYDALQKAHKTLQDRFAETSRDAGYKDTVQSQFAMVVGVFVMAAVAFIGYLIIKGKLRVPGVIG